MCSGRHGGTGSTVSLRDLLWCLWLEPGAQSFLLAGYLPPDNKHPSPLLHEIFRSSLTLNSRARGPPRPTPAWTRLASNGPCFHKLEGGWTVQRVAGHWWLLPGSGGGSVADQRVTESCRYLKCLYISFARIPSDGLGFHGLRTELGFLEEELCEPARWPRALVAWAESGEGEGQCCGPAIPIHLLQTPRTFSPHCVWST